MLGDEMNLIRWEIEKRNYMGQGIVKTHLGSICQATSILGDL